MEMRMSFNPSLRMIRFVFAAIRLWRGDSLDLILMQWRTLDALARSVATGKRVEPPAATNAEIDAAMSGGGRGLE